jgi:XRE family transcriptional regulator, fatty acid utilization regulator
MAKERPIFLGPRLRRLRRDLGLTQSHMAADLDISASYIALLERNQRPMTADLLLRLARTYRLDITELAGDDRDELADRIKGALNDPLFSDLDLPPLEATDVATNFPGITEAILRLYAAYQQDQLALADRSAGPPVEGESGQDPVGDVERFLLSRKNCFPALDEAAEQLAQRVESAGGLVPWFKEKHGLRVRTLPADVMMGSLRRFDRHRDEILLDDTLSSETRQFQLALQLAHLELRRDIKSLTEEAGLASTSAKRLARKGLAAYAAAAILMPYAAFARAVEARHYDIEALSRQFGTSFEQTAHRLTTLQKPGQECVPFFFIRIDPAGNVSKRLDGAGFPFARHGGSCPLWSIHRAFRLPGDVLTQWLELPDGQRFFSIARTVTSNGGGFGVERVERAIALCCAADEAQKLIYTQQPNAPSPDRPTQIGVACRLCHREHCAARSVPPIGRQLQEDDVRSTRAPFAFADS